MTIQEIKAAYTGHFFDEATIKFFGSNVYADVFETAHGTFLFITSEKRPGSDDPRRFTVREYRPADDDIRTVGGFQAYRSKHMATKAIEEILSEGATDEG